MLRFWAGTCRAAARRYAALAPSSHRLWATWNMDMDMDMEHGTWNMDMDMDMDMEHGNGMSERGSGSYPRRAH
jgi:predicted NAD/FAD-binding protein